MARSVAWGIDIGDSAIKAVRLRKVGDSVVIQDYRTVPCDVRPEQAQSSDKEYRIRNALGTLQRELKLKGARLVVSMSGRDVFPRFIPLPPVEKKRIPEIVRYEARTQMPFPIEEVVWDYQPITGDAAAGEEVEVGIFAIKKATVYGFLTNLRLAHLNPDVLDIAPLALYNYLMYDRNIDTGTVVIDIGAGTTDLVIIDGERFWTRNVSISGGDITRALQEKYQISFEEAESLKRKAASSKQADKLFGTMRPILDDLIGEIQRSIGYYKAQTRNVRIERILLLGNAFKLKGLVDYFRNNLDYEVTLLQELRRVKAGSEADASKFEPELPNYAVAIGLALQGLGLARVNIDMMPRDIVRERALRQKIPFAAAAVGLLAVPVFMGFQSAQNELTRLQEAAQAREREINLEQPKVNEIKKWESLEPTATQLREMSALGSGRREWLRFTDSLNRAINEIPRGSFTLRQVAQMRPDELARALGRLRSGGMGRPTPAPSTPAARPQGMGVLLTFEAEKDPGPNGIERLRKTLDSQPYMTAWNQTSQWESSKRTSLGRTASRESDQIFVVVIGVVFNSEPASGEG